MPEHYTHIYYKDCPHFTIGRVDQWGERGYLFYEGMVYDYMEDRKEQYNTVEHPRTVPEFIDFADYRGIEIPERFLEAIKQK